MLKIENLTKKYITGDSSVTALNDVSLCFRKNEIVAILGQSGCGKTTLLNIIGGLDRSTSGEISINGISTKQYVDKDWDKYRNNYIGFIFQSYNLIPHLTVLDNVAMALTLSGVGVKERLETAKQVLEKVGLSDVLSKRPNQLSGGQMQRVAIARALVNSPDIILADEPTGALDVNTGLQVMDLLKEVANDRLVIMVTHNPDLASEYATRIVRITDGQIVDDTNPLTVAEESAERESSTDAMDVNDVNNDYKFAEITTDILDNTISNDSSNANLSSQDNGTTVKLKKVKKVKAKKNNKENKVSMSFVTALKLSFQNLRTKKGRTIITSIAGSIGIIGVALVLAISSGMSSYIKDMQVNTLSNFPITVDATYFELNTTEMPKNPTNKDDINNDMLYPKVPDNYMFKNIHFNKITDQYIQHVNGLNKELYTEILYKYSVYMPLIFKNVNDYKLLTPFDTSTGGSSGVTFQQLPSNAFLNEQFELLGNTSFPSTANQIALVVDSHNQIDTSLLTELGIAYTPGEPLPIANILNKEFSIGRNNDMFTPDNTKPSKYNAKNNGDEISYNNGVKIKITSIIRAKNSSGSAMLSRGLAYTHDLQQLMLEDGKTSNIVLAQVAVPTKNILTGDKFPEYSTNLFSPPPSFNSVMQRLGGIDTPSGISIYPKSFESKEIIKTYLNEYNDAKAPSDVILCSDMTAMMTDTMNLMINTITTVLIAIAAVSLVVSTIMIGIIIYVSVVERTKEIGVLRSIGARKLDISRVFSAEAIIIGAIAGIIGVVLTYLLSIPINLIIVSALGVSGLCSLPFYFAIGLVLLSMTLTTLGGLFPAYKASQKDIVNALRTE